MSEGASPSDEAAAAARSSWRPRFSLFNLDELRVLQMSLRAINVVGLRDPVLRALQAELDDELARRGGGGAS